MNACLCTTDKGGYTPLTMIFLATELQDIGTPYWAGYKFVQNHILANIWSLG